MLTKYNRCDTIDIDSKGNTIRINLNNMEEITMINNSNINIEYENQMVSIAESVMERIEEIEKDDPNRDLDLLLNDLIQEEIDSTCFRYIDQAYCLARYYLSNGYSEDGTINQSDTWEMLYDDVYREVDFLLKERER